MKNSKPKIKAAIFAAILLSMISFVCWIFYMSEPKYINNAKANQQNNIEKYDIVSSQDGYGNTSIGLVMQVDSNFKNETRATVKNYEYTYSQFSIIHLKRYFDSIGAGFTQDYRIIGKGTFYHKVNSFIGFNIMMGTAIIFIILAIIILFFLVGCLREWMGYDEIF